MRIDFEKMKSLTIELEVLDKLNHPNILKSYGFYLGDKNTNPAFLLQFCKYNLEEVITRLKDFELVGVIYEICSAMKYVHERKIIHRDLKMKNILINFKKHVKICDFGIARQIDLTTYTSMTHQVGTLAFMAPELFDPKSKYDEKVDLYSFGVIMFFIVTKGQMPPFKLYECYESYKIPDELKINALSKSIITRCWSKDPKNRPSFDEIINLILENKFQLIDGVQDQISEIKKHLEQK